MLLVGVLSIRFIARDSDIVGFLYKITLVVPGFQHPEKKEKKNDFKSEINMV